MRNATTVNIAASLRRAADASPDAVAVVDSEIATTYRQLASQAAAITELLASRGVGRGDRVVVSLPRGRLAAACIYGAAALGAIVVVASETLRARQLDHICDHSRATLLVTDEAAAARLGRPLETGVAALTLAWSDGGGAGPLAPVANVATDVALLMYTSGSTGQPKGVTLSHGNLWAGVEAVTRYLAITGDDRIASLLPFGFDYGLNQLLCAVAAGACLVVERSPLAPRVVHTLRTHDVTVMPAVPPLWLQLLAVDAFVGTPLPALRAMTNTGGRLPQTAVERLRSGQPQAQLFLMYGLTEAFRSAYLDPRLVDRKPTSIGRAIPGAELLVLTADGRPCAPFEVGELVHRGPTVAMGYWDDPDATARRFRPHPLRPPGTPASERVVFSGDAVYRDADGDLFFVGRDDTMIKTMGHRVSPDEVTDVLLASGEVLEAVVASEPDGLRGAVIVAFVVYAPDGDAQRLRWFVQRELPRYMQPVRIEPRASLVRTASGKYDVAATARDAT